MIAFALMAALIAEPMPAWQPATSNGAYVAGVEGAWRSRGYGYLVDIHAGHLSLYHEADGFCLKDARDGDDPDGQFQVWSSESQTVTKFAGAADSTAYTFDRLATLPAACTEAKALTPDDRYRFVIATLDQWYPSFARRGVDWTALKADIRKRHPHIMTDAEAWSALSEVFTALDDTHTEIEAVIDGEEEAVSVGEASTLHRIAGQSVNGQSVNGQTVNSLTGQPGVKAWLTAWRRGVEKDILQGQGHVVGNSRIFWGRVDDIGYLNVVTMGAFDPDADSTDDVALEAILDEAMTSFSGAKAVLVDVSNNRGGYDTLSKVIAARFAAHETLAFTKQPAGTTEPAQVFYLRPSARPRFTGPVYLLTSDITVSAGETFVAYMRSLPNVVQVGTATRGFLSDQIEKPIGDGWRFSLSAEIYRDASGYWPEGKGFSPDVELDLYGGPDSLTSHAQAVQALMQRVKSGDPTLRRQRP